VEYRLRRLGRADLARQDQDVDQRRHPELDQKISRVLVAVADDRGFDPAGSERPQERQHVVVQARAREQQFPALVRDRNHQARFGLGAAGSHDPRVSLTQTKPSVRHRRLEPLELGVHRVRRDPGQHRQLSPVRAEVAAQDGVVDVNEACLESGHPSRLEDAAPATPR
jgi:hypothetical protein